MSGASLLKTHYDGLIRRIVKSLAFRGVRFATIKKHS